MRKKELNRFKPIKNLGPPYLTPEQISEFQAEFTLFDRQLSIKKIYEAMVAQNLSKTDRLVHSFMNEFKNKETIGFDQYIREMINYFQKQNINEIILQILGETETGEISKEIVKEVLEDSLGRDISTNQLQNIMIQLKKEAPQLLKGRPNKQN